MIKTALPVFLAWAMTGCATLMNGVRQPLEVRSDPPVRVVLNDGQAQQTPVVLALPRRADHVVKLVRDGGSDTTVLHILHKPSGWLWGNALFGPYGLGALGIDFLTGGAYKLQLPGAGEELATLPARVDLAWDPDPRSYGTWHLSLGFLTGAKHFSSGATGGDAGFQLVTGGKNWPVELMAEGFFFSATQDVLDWRTAVLLNAGLRKTLFRGYSASIYPHLGAGLTLLSRSTQAGRGLPLGFWARGGVDLRLGKRWFIGPYAGYSKLEMGTSQSSVNTAGPTWGLVLGQMW